MGRAGRSIFRLVALSKVEAVAMIAPRRRTGAQEGDFHDPTREQHRPPPDAPGRRRSRWSWPSATSASRRRASPCRSAAGAASPSRPCGWRAGSCAPPSPRARLRWRTFVMNAGSSVYRLPSVHLLRREPLARRAARRPARQGRRVVARRAGPDLRRHDDRARADRRADDRRRAVRHHLPQPHGRGHRERKARLRRDREHRGGERGRRAGGRGKLRRDPG